MKVNRPRILALKVGAKSHPNFSPNLGSPLLKVSLYFSELHEQKPHQIEKG